MKAGTVSLHGCKTAVAVESPYLVASRKAMDGEDPLETGMNEGGPESMGSGGRIQKGRPLYPFVLEGSGEVGTVSHRP